MTQQFYRAAIGAFIVNENGEILITHNYGNEDKWNFPKGGIVTGESDEEALRRELNEELGITNIQIITKSKIAIIYRLDPEYIEQENLNYIGQAQRYYWVFIKKDTRLNVPNEEVEKYKWIAIDSSEIAEHFKKHDSEKILQTFLPIEFEELKSLLQNYSKS